MLNQTRGLLLTGLIAAAVLILTACSSQPLKIDDPVPNFTLNDYTGKAYSLSDYAGKPVLLHYWDTTFDACKDELPGLQAIHEDWLVNGKAVLLTIDALESANTVKTFMETNKYTFPVLIDTDAKVAGKFNVTMVPTSIFIDQYGKLKLNVVGPFKDKTAIEKQLAAFLP